MSTSSPLGKNDLLVEGPLGTPIQIIDGKFRTIATGVGRLFESLPEGLYTIRWLGTEPEERNIRIFASDEPLVVKGGGVSHLQSIALPRSSDGLPKFNQPDANHGDRYGVDRPSLTVVVIADDPAVRLRSDPARSIRVLDAARAEVARWSEERRGTFGTFDVPLPPGSYFLRYDGTGARLVEQVVTVLPRRRTIVRLSNERGYVFRGKQGEAVRRSQRAINPARSIILSVPYGSVLVPEGDVVRAGAMLRSLSTPSKFIDERLIMMLGSHHDPYLRLYAAASAAVASRNTDPPAWTKQLAERSADGLPKEFSSDAVALSYALERERPPGVPISLKVPPMLAASWVWISERSLQDPQAVERNEATEAAADAHSAFLPWLVWGASDARKTISSNTRAEMSSEDAEVRLRALLDEIITEASKRFLASESLITPAIANFSRRLQTNSPLGAENERFLADVAHIWPIRKVEDLSVALGRLGLPAQSFVHRAEETLLEIRSKDRDEVFE